MTSQSHTHGHGDDFVIGFDIGPFGRMVRLLGAVYFLLFFVAPPLLNNTAPPGGMLPFTAEIAMWVGALTVIYFVGFYVAGEFLLAKMNPWTGTMVFLGLPTLIGLAGYMPAPVQVAFGVYVSLSLFLIVAMKYGGCEVVALPSLLLRKRFTMYCPYNAIDVVERGVTPAKGSKAEPFLALISLFITVFVGSWFLAFQQHGLMLREWGMTGLIDKFWVLLLVFPVLHLAYRAFNAFREAGSPFDKTVYRFGLGSLILALYVAVFLGLIPFQPLWMGAMGLGTLYVIYEVFQFATGRKTFGQKTGTSDDLTAPAQATVTSQARD